MRILPVIDLLDGVVVRGVAGRRDEYRPVESCLADGADAMSIACAFRDKLGLASLYVADLDAILHERPNVAIYRALAGAGFELMIDAGIREFSSAEAALNAGAASIVAGLETLPGPGLLRLLCSELPASRVVFSLDMRAGRLLGETGNWKGTSPLDIAIEAVEAGVGRVIALDLAQVGVGEGVATLELCRTLRDRFPMLELMTGGGVRNAADLAAAKAAGVDGVLVASALHNGAIGRADVEDEA